MVRSSLSMLLAVLLLILDPQLACCFVPSHPSSLQPIYAASGRPTSLHMSLSTSTPTSMPRPWYSNPDMDRDRSHVLDAPDNSMADLLSDSDNELWSSSRFILRTQQGMWHQAEPQIAPLFLTRDQVKEILGGNIGTNDNESKQQALLAWVGKHQEEDYWIIYVPNEMENLEHTINNVIPSGKPACKSLREFGDSRKCTSCQRSVYPRLDVAAIMLVTSPCEQYALLGRKTSWPAGRYSTLAGFCEVGETLEDCCRRETFEESGVVVDPSSVEFVASQPWPFPRSLMVGFRAKAQANNGSSDEEAPLPEIVVEIDEMQDIQWFAKDFVKDRLQGGSTAADFHPNEAEAVFHIPGKASLARLLITRWTEEP